VADYYALEAGLLAVSRVSIVSVQSQQLPLYCAAAPPRGSQDCWIGKCKQLLLDLRHSLRGRHACSLESRRCFFSKSAVAVALCCSASAKLTGLLDQRMQTVAPGLALQYSTRSSRWLHCCAWLRCDCVEGLVDSGLEILVRYLPWSHQTDMSQDSHGAFLPGKIAEQS
jgi:hypothetical protein